MSTKILPGVLLCAAVSAAAAALQVLEIHLFGRAWLESLVLAILLGTAVRTLTPLSARWQPGIHFSAKTLLELAVLLLGTAVCWPTAGRCWPASPPWWWRRSAAAMPSAAPAACRTSWRC